MLAARGAEVIEADRIGHAVLEPDGEAFEAVAARWPTVVRFGRIDRAALGAIVFRDETELAALEALTHPSIAVRIDELAAEAGGRVVVVELPLTKDLMGPGWHRVVVIADADLRLDRAVRRGMDEAEVRARMAAQAPPEAWLAIADSVIVNDGDLARLERRVDEWWQREVTPFTAG